MSITAQCEALGLPRSSWYYQAVGESPENLALMCQIDELYLKYPFFDSHEFAQLLVANRKRIDVLLPRAEILPR